jgi:hypothetical protein
VLAFLLKGEWAIPEGDILFALMGVSHFLRDENRYK